MLLTNNNVIKTILIIFIRNKIVYSKNLLRNNNYVDEINKKLLVNHLRIDIFFIKSVVFYSKITINTKKKLFIFH